jgi:type VI secretion system protein ImpK
MGPVMGKEVGVSDNPFAEPGDDDRTVIRPVPGGRRTPTSPPLAAPARATSEPAPRPEPSRTPAISVSPLSAAAAPLLQLLARLRGTRQQVDPKELHERATRALLDFERRARDAGIAMELVRPAHYALCASIDDVVLNTPWGATGGWASRSLVATFHHGAGGDDQFFDQLRQLRKNPDRFLPAIELMYLCLSLGFMGRYRQSQGDVGEFDRLRAETHATIAAQRKPADQALSRHWQGISAPYRSSRGRLPIWVVAAAAMAACGGLFFWVSTGLNAASDVLHAEVLAAPPSRMPQVSRAALVQPLPPPPTPAEPVIVDRLRGLLKPEIDRGLVSVLGTAATPIVRIADRALFESTSAVVQPAAVPLLERIGAALMNEAGSLTVLAYTDNQPIRTVQFPSGFQLSAARAQAVRAVIARGVGDTTRVRAEGRADADPIATNTTAEGREQNRRIEIVLRRQD